MVISNSKVYFEGSSLSYTLPHALDVDPSMLLDEKEGVYRLALGNTNLPDDEAAMYQPLFVALDARLKVDCFVEDMVIETGDKRLIFKLALVDKTVSKYGVSYDISAAFDEVEFKDIKKEAKNVSRDTKRVSARGKKNVESPTKRQRARH